MPQFLQLLATHPSRNQERLTENPEDAESRGRNRGLDVGQLDDKGAPVIHNLNPRQ